MDYQARFLNPGLGRFTQPDTIIPDPANPQNLNRHSYVINNPMRFSDPSGHVIKMPDNENPCVDAYGNVIPCDSSEPELPTKNGPDGEICYWKPIGDDFFISSAYAYISLEDDFGGDENRFKTAVDGVAMQGTGISTDGDGNITYYSYSPLDGSYWVLGNKPVTFIDGTWTYIKNGHLVPVGLIPKITRVTVEGEFSESSQPPEGMDPYRTIAANWNFTYVEGFTYGTRIYIPGYPVFTYNERCPACKDHHFDVFVGVGRQTALSWINDLNNDGPHKAYIEVCKSGT